ncbi:hypothetical protein N7486_000101 [Penicillium sp. IBT 16267x]|nr:hypothetical protein N7486_000101 [Penicillium sp. IBT 16267x]
MEKDRNESEPGNVPQELNIQIMTAVDFQAEKKSTRQRTVDSGSLTTRLQGIEEWSPETKTTILSSIADDMAKTLMLIGRHSETGTLDHTHTQRISDIIDIVLNTDERIARHKILRLRQGNREQRRSYRLLVSETEEALENYDRKVQGLKARVQDLRGELLDLKGERELMLRRIHYMEKGGDRGEDGEDDTTGEEREVESPQDQDMAGLTDDDGEWEEDLETEL